METNCKAIVSLLEQLFFICVTPELLQQDWIFLQTHTFHNTWNNVALK